MRFLFVLVLLVGAHAAAESRKDVESQNQYGGRTVEIAYEAGDPDYGTLEVSRLYLDAKGALVRSVSRLAADKTAETGIVFQEIFYTLGVRSTYKMHYSDEHKRIHGYDTLVERVDAQDKTLALTYGKNGREVEDSNTSFMKNYPFFTISYAEERLFEDYRPNPKGDAVSFSAKFHRGRAFVVFEGPIEEMTPEDTKIASYYFASLGIQQGLDQYTQKTRVNEDGRSYTIFLQKGLVPYIKAGNAALITYLNLGLNKELFLLITGFIDIKPVS